MSDPAVTVAALLAAGYLLMAVEVFVVPGFGIAGILGLLCLGAGCYLAFDVFGTAYGTLSVVLVLGSITAVMLWIPKSRFGRDVVHSGSLSKARSAESRLQPGAVGMAESDLRPSGVARFGELRQSVVTEGEFIGAGSRVVVTETHGARIVVEQVEQTGDETERAPA